MTERDLQHEALLLRARRALRAYARVEPLLLALPDPNDNIAELDRAMRSLGERVWAHQSVDAAEPEAARLLPQIARDV